MDYEPSPVAADARRATIEQLKASDPLAGAILELESADFLALVDAVLGSPDQALAERDARLRREGA
jgi:hypothetical protein